jgi:hypothetical protein
MMVFGGLIYTDGALKVFEEPSSLFNIVPSLSGYEGGKGIRIDASSKVPVAYENRPASISVAAYISY